MCLSVCVGVCKISLDWDLRIGDSDAASLMVQGNDSFLQNRYEKLRTSHVGGNPVKMEDWIADVWI